MRTDLRTELEELIDDYRSMSERLARMNAELADRAASARSSDGSVSVTVGPHGELVRLSIDPVLGSRMDLRALSARVLEAAARAHTDLREQLRVALLDALPERLRSGVLPDGEVDFTRLMRELRGRGAAGGE